MTCDGSYSRVLVSHKVCAHERYHLACQHAVPLAQLAVGGCQALLRASMHQQTTADEQTLELQVLHARCISRTGCCVGMLHTRSADLVFLHAGSKKGLEAAGANARLVRCCVCSPLLRLGAARIPPVLMRCAR